jgi:hypothetical protein
MAPNAAVYGRQDNAADDFGCRETAHSPRRSRCCWRVVFVVFDLNFFLAGKLRREFAWSSRDANTMLFVAATSRDLPFSSPRLVSVLYRIRIRSAFCTGTKTTKEMA